jgi:uncharacterized protein (TIGR00255 family)
MTGFGKATYEDDQIMVYVEVKSINAKYADINLQVPKLLTEQMLSWRNLAQTHLQRGKIDLFINYVDKQQSNPSWVVQESLFKVYYHTFERLAQEVGASTHPIFQMAMQAPGVMLTNMLQETIHTSVLQKIESALQTALQRCKQARVQEGEVLAKNIRDNLAKITQELAQVDQLDSQRITRIKERLVEKLNLLPTTRPLDETRLEQEMIYYLEKLDFREERVRLASHLSYFEQVMSTDPLAGRNLSFIAQEIGRELNTLGAKANDAAIQQHVTIMKNELEKIKEQLLNIL